MVSDDVRNFFEEHKDEEIIFQSIRSRRCRLEDNCWPSPARSPINRYINRYGAPRSCRGENASCLLTS